MGQLVDRSKRIRLHLPVDIRGQDISGATFSQVTHSLNISGGGILLESRRKVAVGGRLHLSIEVPEPLRRHFGNLARYETMAVVCRVEHLGDEPAFRVGARFLAATAEPG
jgi:hypothetical protein